MPRWLLERAEVWFGTSDAPAPPTVTANPAPEITVGVRGAEEAAVVVRYRRLGGPWQRLRLLPLGAAAGEPSYFTAQFPPFLPGTRVEYEVHVRWGGRRPAPERRVG